MDEGHRRTNMPCSLNARASAAKTGGATLSFERTAESRPRLGLRPSARPRSAGYDRTSSNVIEGIWQRIPAGHVRASTTPIWRRWTPRMLQTSNRTGCYSIAESKSHLGTLYAALSAVYRDGESRMRQ